MDLAWLTRAQRPRILVVGDVILDRFIHGDAARISPEAPVPVVRQNSVEHRPGGAANVAANVMALGGQVACVGVVGDDEAGAALRALLEERGVGCRGLVTLRGRPTTVKTRVIARHQQVLRVDVEDESPVAAPSAGEVCSRALAALPEADALVISDYAKGVVDRALLGQVLGEARRAGLPAIVDPKSSELSRYAPASVITPNEGELARAAGRALHDLAEIEGAARELIAEGVDAFVVTLGERGMLVVPAGKAAESIPARAREVFDVTGAGDTVTASLALALSAGLSLGEAARIGNAAAAVAVSRVGTSAVSWQEVSALEAPT